MSRLRENLPPCYGVFLYLIGRLSDTRRAPRCFSSRWVNLGSSSRFHLPLRNSPPPRNFRYRRLSHAFAFSLLLTRQISTAKDISTSFSHEHRYLETRCIFPSSFTFVQYSCGGSTITCQIRERTRGVRVQAEPVTTGVVGPIVPEKDSESGLGADDVGDRPLPSLPPLISDYPARVQEWRMASLSFWNRARDSTVSSHAAVLPLSSALRVRSSSCLLPGCCTVI